MPKRLKTAVTDTACPCCAAPADTRPPSPAYAACSRCGHRWCGPAAQTGSRYYESLAQRNDLQTPWFQRKTAERAAALGALIGPQVRRILEVGCAEGALGQAVKAAHEGVVYDGVELSQDADRARQVLNQVFQTPAPQVDAAPYDLIVSFHVLEHIADLGPELQAWRRLLAPGGRVLVEVPHRSGHPLLDSDRNPEHLHQFTPASLAMLLTSQGLSCHGLSLGHYESPVYPDSLRALAHIPPSPGEQRERLVERFRQRMGGPFVAYGIGGDFHNYVLPIADALDIRALADTAPQKWGQPVGRHTITAYDPAGHAAYPVLICSIRFGLAIKKHLLKLGTTPEQLIDLQDIYDISSRH